MSDNKNRVPSGTTQENPPESPGRVAHISLQLGNVGSMQCPTKREEPERKARTRIGMKVSYYRANYFAHTPIRILLNKNHFRLLFVTHQREPCHRTLFLDFVSSQQTSGRGMVSVKPPLAPGPWPGALSIPAVGMSRIIGSTTALVPQGTAHLSPAPSALGKREKGIRVPPRTAYGLHPAFSRAPGPPANIPPPTAASFRPMAKSQRPKAVFSRLYLQLSRAQDFADHSQNGSIVFKTLRVPRGEGVPLRDSLSAIRQNSTSRPLRRKAKRQGEERTAGPSLREG